VNAIALRAPGTELDDLPLCQGRLAVGRALAGGICVVDDAAAARVCFCVDRRGTWLLVAEGVRGVHVNGRPVQRKALLRAGDTVYVDGVEIDLVGSVPPLVGAGQAAPSGVAACAAPTMGRPDPRVLLRGTSGPHHGRSLTLERPRIIGSDAGADVRVGDLAPRHVRLAMEGDQAVLRVLAPEADVLVNGEPRRSAILQPGDQLALDAHHRFVLEAPTALLGVKPDGDDELEPLVPREEPSPPAAPKLRMPWLLLAALLLAAILSALLLL